LKYQAFLTTSSGGATPTLNDVAVCFDNTAPTTLVVNSATGTYGGTVNLSATLTDGVSPLSGKTVGFSLNGNSVGNAVTSGSGVASLSNVSLAGINANTYPTSVAASFAGDATYQVSSATNSLTVNKANATINVTPYSVTYDGNAHTATGTATGGNGESLTGLDLSGTTHTNAGSYPGDAWTFTNINYNDASGTVDDHIGSATLSFFNLSSPTIGCGATPTALSGQIRLGSLIPIGTVAITFNGVTQNAPIQPDGSFSAFFATGPLTPSNSPLSITYSYGGDSNFSPINGTGTLTVVDTALPTITLSGNTISLWPTNKKYQSINVADLVSSAGDSCDLSVNLNSVVISKVTSDEGTSNSGDIIIAANCKSVQLRSDRDGTGDGRVYTITFRVRDSWGNTTTKTAQVTVPHDQGSGSNAVDSGAAYTINGSCP
jgi:hypothetical protein